MFSKYPINKKANLKNVSIESKLMNIDEVLYNCDKYSLEDKEKSLLISNLIQMLYYVKIIIIMKVVD